MKNVLALLFVLVGASAAQAVSPQSGEYVCSRINDHVDRASCFQVVYSATRIDRWAAGACDRLRGSDETLRCMRAIAGDRFQIPAVEACDRINDGNSTIRCLNAIANKTYSQYEIDGCDREYGAEETIECFRLGGNGGHRPPTGGGGHRPPTPAGDTCYVRELHRYVDGDEFFSLASQRANQRNKCVVAKISFLPYSNRIYNRDGERVARERGGLSNSEVERILDDRRLYGCLRMSCDRE